MARCASLKTLVFCLPVGSQFPLLPIKELLSLSLDPTSYVTHTINPNDLQSVSWKEHSDVIFVDRDACLLTEQLIGFQEEFGGCVVSFDQKYNNFCQLNYQVECKPPVNSRSLSTGSSSPSRDNTEGSCVSDYIGDIPSTIGDLYEICTVHGGKSVLCDERILSIFGREDDKVSRVVLFKQLMTSCGLTALSEPIRSAKITAGYLVLEDEACKEYFLSQIRTNYESKQFKEKDFRIDFIKSGDPLLKLPSNTFLPIYVDRRPPSDLFDIGGYFRALSTNYLGRSLIYTEVTSSSLDILNSKFIFSLPEQSSLLVICSRQTQGKGRGSNQWVSPPGCLMFSHLISIKQSSFLAKHMTLLQHIISVAIVHSVLTLPKYEQLGLRLKWPNDIYFGNTKKLGGILVHNFSMGSVNKCIISVGMNIATENLFSLNSVIDEFNSKNGSSLPHLKMEYILAKSLNLLEIFIQEIEDGKLSDILKLYYKYWLHSNAEIAIWNSDDTFVIQSLDEYGYLAVMSKRDGTVFSVQPDKNSFDMLKGVITQKV